MTAPALSPRVIAAVLWLLALALALLLGVSLSQQETTGLFEFNGKGVVTLLLPALLFGSAPLWLQGHPLDFRQYSKHVDAKHGPGTYAAYVKAVRPLVLMSCAGLITGLICVFSAYRAGAGPSAYASGFLFLSAALGFVLCLAGLRKQGHRLE